MRNHLIASTILAAGWKRQACPQSKNQQISLLLTSGDKLPQEQQSMSYQGKGVLLGGSGGFSAHGVQRQKPCSHQNQGISPLSDLTEQNSCSPPPPAMFSQKLWKESDAGTQCLGHGAEVVCPYVSSRRKGWINEDTIPDIPGGF